MKFGAMDLTARMRKLDTEKVGLSIAGLKYQIRDAIGQFPKQVGLRNQVWRRVIFCAMGGSGLGADVLRSVYATDLRVPVDLVHEYRIPESADASALVVICSYSGNTEEMISCYEQARERSLPAFIIAGGGELAQRARMHGTPCFIFTGTHNPSQQPRIGTGYTMAGLYMLLKKCRLLSRSHEDLLRATGRMTIDQRAPARLAHETLGHSFIIIAAEHLQGNAHVLSNQLNETAKVFAPHFFLPELNHHLLEGLGSLQPQTRRWTALFLESSHYSERIQKRIAVTKKVMHKQGVRHRSIEHPGSRVIQGLKTLSFGAWFSYYQGIMQGFRPASIPWVDYFKEQL